VFTRRFKQYWVHEYTEVIAKNPLLEMTPPKERLRMISTLVFEQNLTRFDAAMYVWANKKTAQRYRGIRLDLLLSKSV